MSHPRRKNYVGTISSSHLVSTARWPADAFARGEGDSRGQFDVLRDHHQARRDLETRTEAFLRRFGNL
ncbi:hypothetical protein [Alloactinosynnema sp. L-07]|uniref:hypothetical protein n=1 Tax=Alloactinosynnema sp. L-07 TaxID=1653480 RepID=UPI00065EFDA7|nr:hypothetical protein [Alloactinosynnema sp. L-07]CRK56877.1 hypothetical protein [Alloactinosynnema sp. L-07]